MLGTHLQWVEEVPILDTAILLKCPGLTQVETLPSPGNKASGMARHEEEKGNIGNGP